MFKPLPSNTNAKAEVKAEKSKPKYVKAKDVNKYLKNRKMKKVVAKNGTVTIYLTDGRRIIISTGETPKFKIKRNGACMDQRDLKEMNYQIETVYKKMVKDVPRECKPCFLTISAEDLI